MTKGLKIWLGVCIAGFMLGFALLFSTAATAADGTSPKPESTTSTTEKPNGDTVTQKTETKQETDWLAPGGILTVSIGGIFLIVREVKSIRDMDLQKFKTRAEVAEAKVETETNKLAAQIERLEKKLDDALEDVETKHDEWVAEVAHRRKLEILLAENGILIPQVLPPVTG